MKHLLLGLLFLGFLNVSGQEKTTTYLTDPSATPPDLIITLTHIRADVRFKPEENLILAKTEFTFTPNRYHTDSIIFYAPEFKVNSIQITGKEFSIKLQPSDWKFYGSNLVLYPGRDLSCLSTEVKSYLRLNHQSSC